MDQILEQRILELEKKVAALEGQIQKQLDMKLIIKELDKKLKETFAKSFIPQNPFQK